MISLALSSTEITDKLALNKMQNRIWHVQPSCAITGEGLSDGIDWLSQKLKK